MTQNGRLYHRKVVAYTAISTQGRHMSGVQIAMRPWSRRQQMRGNSGPRQNLGIQLPSFLARFSLSFAPCLFSACTMVKAYPSQALMCNTIPLSLLTVHPRQLQEHRQIHSIAASFARSSFSFAECLSARTHALCTPYMQQSLSLEEVAACPGAHRSARQSTGQILKHKRSEKLFHVAAQATDIRATRK